MQFLSLWLVISKKKREKVWVELTYAKNSGTVTKDREKNWPITERRVPGSDPTCGKHFCSSLPHISKQRTINKLLLNDKNRCRPED